MKFPCVALATVAVMAFDVPARAEANSLQDYFGPRELSVGEAMRADARGVQATTLNPAGLILSRELVFEGSYGYRPDDGASAVTLSACDSTVPVPGCFYYRYFGASPELGDLQARRRVHEGGASFARAISARAALGATIRYFDYESDLMGEEDASGVSFDVGGVVRATDMVNLAVVGYNLRGTGSAQYPRAVGAGVSARPSMDLALAVDAVWNLETPEGQSTGRYGGGAEYFIRASTDTGYPLRAGVVHDAELGTYITGGVGLQTTKLGVDIGARKQVSGDGDELLVLASLRFFGPRQVMGAPGMQ
jgi:hypothetical protein